MVTPSVRALKRSFPDAYIYFITGKSNKAVMENNKYIDELITIDDRVIFTGNIIERAKECLKLRKIIMGIKPSEAFILHRDWRYNLLFFLSGVKKRYGFKRDLKGLFLTNAVDTNAEEHETTKFYKVFSEKEGYGRDGFDMDLLPTALDRKTIDEYLGDRIKDKKAMIALAVGGALNVKEEMDIKRWGLDNYAKLLDRLLNGQCHVYLIGGHSDKKFSAELVGNFKGYENSQLFDVTGEFSVAGTKYLLEKMDAMITHDCGPMHIGAAAKIPVIAIFGPTNPKELSPVTNSGSCYLWAGKELPCCPCYRDGVFPECSYDNACMKRITPDMVFEKLNEILRESKESHYDMDVTGCC